jgi:hypothetical protein
LPGIHDPQRPSLAPPDDHRQTAAWAQRDAQQRLRLYTRRELQRKPRHNTGKQDGGFLQREGGAEADARAGAEGKIRVTMHVLAAGAEESGRIEFVRTLP